MLVTSNQTGFDVDYLVELAARIQISSLTFEGYFFVPFFKFVSTLFLFCVHAGEAKTYNRFHCRNLPTDVKDRRSELFRQRVSDGYFMFIYLELCQQLGITDYQVNTGFTPRHQPGPTARLFM